MTGDSLTFNGITIAVPRGWEAEFGDGGEYDQGQPVEHASVVLHLANFALPPKRGDYGSGAVEIMGGGAIFISVWEYGALAADAALFRGKGVPGALTGSDFSADALQRRLAGQAGLQRFFQAQGRAFVLYVVIGSYRARNILCAEVNRVLAGLQIE